MLSLESSPVSQHLSSEKRFVVIRLRWTHQKWVSGRRVSSSLRSCGNFFHVEISNCQRLIVKDLLSNKLRLHHHVLVGDVRRHVFLFHILCFRARGSPLVTKPIICWQLFPYESEEAPAVAHVRGPKTRVCSGCPRRAIFSFVSQEWKDWMPDVTRHATLWV